MALDKLMRTLIMGKRILKIDGNNKIHENIKQMIDTLGIAQSIECEGDYVREGVEASFPKEERKME